MKNDIKVDVSGGSANIGAIVRGNHNNIKVSLSIDMIEKAFEKAVKDSSTLGKELGRPASELELLKEQVDLLKKECMSPSPDNEKGTDILGKIRENFSWAYTIVKDVLKIAWPILLGAIST